MSKGTMDVVVMAHGGGGSRMHELLESVIFPALGDASMRDMEDASLLEMPDGRGRLAFTTDGFVVRPLFFPGGDIGRLSLCGTVNDLAMRGASPLYISLGLILEEGLPLDDLNRALRGLAEAAGEAGVKVACGDIKVVESGAADGLFINTAGVGWVPEGREVGISGARPGDLLLVNGFLGDHGISVLCCREGFDFQLPLRSDCAPLNGLVERILEAGEVHAMRDPTRGGLATAVLEMAFASGCSIELREEELPVREAVRAACEMLGLDPLMLPNEGKLVAAVPEDSAAEVLEAMRSHPLGVDAAVVGRVTGKGKGEAHLLTPYGSRRILRMPSGEQLPRIC